MNAAVAHRKLTLDLETTTQYVVKNAGNRYYGGAVRNVPTFVPTLRYARLFPESDLPQARVLVDAVPGCRIETWVPPTLDELRRVKAMLRELVDMIAGDAMQALKDGARFGGPKPSVEAFAEMAMDLVGTGSSGDECHATARKVWEQVPQPLAEHLMLVQCKHVM